MLNPAVSVLMPSHMKPDWLPSAAGSVLNQTRRDLELLILDSGAWIGQLTSEATAMAAAYQSLRAHPLVQWHTRVQPPVSQVCPYAHALNLAVVRLPLARYVCVLPDDDLLGASYVERMAGFLDSHPEHLAVYCAQEQVRCAGPAEPWAPVRTLTADEPITGPHLLDRVDMVQMMFRADVLRRLDPWGTSSGPFDESPADESCRRADGIFMNRVGALGTVAAISDVLCTHRYTPDSTYN